MVGATLAERAEARTQGRTLYRRSKARWPGLLARGAARRRDSARVPLLAKTGEAAAAAKRRGEEITPRRATARGPVVAARAAYAPPPASVVRFRSRWEWQRARCGGGWRIRTTPGQQVAPARAVLLVNTPATPPGQDRRCCCASGGRGIR